MKLSNAIRKLERAGWDVQPESGEHRSFYDGHVLLPCFYYAHKPGNRHVITLTRNGEDDAVATINVRGEQDRDEPQSDYYAGSYVSSIAQALHFARS